MIRFLAENIDYKVYSVYESVYLKNKLLSKIQNDYDENDKLITDHYGDPTGAIILNSGKHIIVSGCGLSIYDIDKGIDLHILAEKDNITWSNGLYQDELDDQSLEFRFVTFNTSDKLRVFKMNLTTKKMIEIDK